MDARRRLAFKDRYKREREREREGMKDYVPNEISEQNKATAKVSENQSRYILISYDLSKRFNHDDSIRQMYDVMNYHN